MELTICTYCRKEGGKILKSSTRQLEVFVPPIPVYAHASCRMVKVHLPLTLGLLGLTPFFIFPSIVTGVILVMACISLTYFLLNITGN